MKSSLLPSDQILKTKEDLDRIQFKEFIETYLPYSKANDKDIKPFSDFFVRFFNLSIDIGDSDDLENYAISRSTLADDSLKNKFFTKLFENEAKKFCQIARTAKSENVRSFQEFFNHYLDFFIEKLTNEYKELKQKKERGETGKDPEYFLEIRKVFFSYILTQADDLKVFFLENQRFREEPLLKSCLANYPDLQGQNTIEQPANDGSQRNRIAQLEQELEKSRIFIEEKDKLIAELQKKIEKQETISKAQDSLNSIQIESKKIHDQIVKNLQGQRDELGKAYSNSLNENAKLKRELAQIKFELENKERLIYQKTQENSRLTQDNIALTQEKSILTKTNISLAQENSRLQKQVQNEVRSENPLNRDPQEKEDRVQEESGEELSKEKLYELLEKLNSDRRKIARENNSLRLNFLELKKRYERLTKRLLSKSSEAEEASRSSARHDKDLNIDSSYNKTDSLKFVKLAPIGQSKEEYLDPTNLTLKNEGESSDPRTDQGLHANSSFGESSRNLHSTPIDTKKGVLPCQTADDSTLKKEDKPLDPRTDQDFHIDGNYDKANPLKSVYLDPLNKIPKKCTDQIDSTSSISGENVNKQASPIYCSASPMEVNSYYSHQKADDSKKGTDEASSPSTTQDQSKDKPANTSSPSTTQDQSFTKDIQDNTSSPSTTQDQSKDKPANTSSPSTTKPKPILKKSSTTKDPQASTTKDPRASEGRGAPKNLKWGNNLYHEEKPISTRELTP